MYDSELHQFKTDINLVQYAIDRYGYQRDRRERAARAMSCVGP
jgi:hypothetical protein